MPSQTLHSFPDQTARPAWHGSGHTSMMACIAFVLVTSLVPRANSQSNLEARRSLSVTTTVQRMQYCRTADKNVDLLRIELAITLRNIGSKAVILPRGPYPIPCFAIGRSPEELDDKRFELNSCSTVFIDRSLPKPSSIDDSPDPRFWVVLVPAQSYESTGEVLFNVSSEAPLSSPPAQAPARFCACHDTVIAWPGTPGLESIPARARDAGDSRVVATGQHVLVAEVYGVTPHDYQLAKAVTWSKIGLLVDDFPFSAPMRFQVDAERVRVDCR